MADWNMMASSSYQAANLLVQKECDRSSISRAYYAAYSRATHVLAARLIFPVGREGPAHARLPELVENHLQILGGSRWQLSGYLQELRNLRVIADYRPSVGIDCAASRTALNLMGQVFFLTKGALP